MADSQSAAAAYFRNLERLDYDISRAAIAEARPVSLVHGVYRLEDRRSHSFIALITERGDIRGDATGWSRVGKDGITPLSEAESAQLRAEVMRNIAWERLAPVRYGNGGGRKIILVSAVDCPYCAKLEASLAQWTQSLQTTFYVLPSALMPLGAGAEGVKAWSTVAAIWCAPDAGAAWTRFWVTHSVPARGEGCVLDAERAQQDFKDFGSVMSSIGTQLRGTPGFIREDGTAFGMSADFNLTYARSVYGPQVLGEFHSPLADAAPFAWLAAQPTP